MSWFQTQVRVPMSDTVPNRSNMSAILDVRPTPVTRGKSVFSDQLVDGSWRLLAVAG